MLHQSARPDPGRAQPGRNGRGARRRLGACCPAGPSASGPALMGHRPAGVPWSLGRVAGRVAPGPGVRWPAGPRGVRRRRRGGDGPRRGVGARPPPADGRLAGRPEAASAAACLAAAATAASRRRGLRSSAVRSRCSCPPLGIALALLAQPRPQVLGLGVGALAQQIGDGCPLRSSRALLVQVGPEGPGPGSPPGPGAGLRRCRPGRQGCLWCRRCTARGSCGLPW